MRDQSILGQWQRKHLSNHDREDLELELCMFLWSPLHSASIQQFLSLILGPSCQMTMISYLRCKQHYLQLQLHAVLLEDLLAKNVTIPCGSVER